MERPYRAKKLDSGRVLRSEFSLQNSTSIEVGNRDEKRVVDPLWPLIHRDRLDRVAIPVTQKNHPSAGDCYAHIHRLRYALCLVEAWRNQPADRLAQKVRLRWEAHRAMAW